MKSVYTFLTKRGQLIALSFALICIIIIFTGITGGLSDAGYDMSLDLVPIMQDAESTQDFNFFTPAVAIPSILICISFILVALFLLVNILFDPKGSIKLIVCLVVLGLIFFGLYGASEAETTGKIGMLAQEFNVSNGTSKYISGGIKTTIGLAIVAAVSMVLMEIWNMFK